MHATDFVKSYMAAWNHHDPEEVANHLGADGVYRDVPLNTQSSHDELITALYDFFADFRHRYELIGNVLTNGDTVAFQYRMVPPHRDGEGLANHRGAEFVTLRNDSALLIVDYYEAAEQPRQSIVESGRPHGSRKYAKSGLSPQQLDVYKARLSRLMDDHRIFLSPGLTLPQLAETVGCSVNHLSQVINAGFGVSFFDYINRYRVRHAKMLLNNLDDQSAVLNVAFTVGFNSNSAFYAAFKKHVGMTPAQFRRIRIRANG